MALSGLCARAQYNSNTNQYQNDMPPVSMSEYHAQRIGVGVTFGEPVGGIVKYWMNETVALDAAGGWSIANHSDAEVHADILFHKFDLIPIPRGELPVYAGLGMLGRFRHTGFDHEAGFRIPFGISYMFDNCPVDIFAEVAPEILFTPDVDGGVDGGAGVRFWF